MFEKKQLKSLEQDVRRVLMEVWDPIGVKDEPACADEYDSYAPAILGMLIHGADDEVIAKHLVEIVTERMGLGATVNAMLPTVRALREIEIEQVK